MLHSAQGGPRLPFSPTRSRVNSTEKEGGRRWSLKVTRSRAGARPLSVAAAVPRCLPFFSHLERTPNHGHFRALLGAGEGDSLAHSAGPADHHHSLARKRQARVRGHACGDAVLHAIHARHCEEETETSAGVRFATFVRAHDRRPSERTQLAFSFRFNSAQYQPRGDGVRQRVQQGLPLHRPAARIPVPPLHAQPRQVPGHPVLHESAHKA